MPAADPFERNSLVGLSVVSYDQKWVLQKVPLIKLSIGFMEGRVSFLDCVDWR